MYRCEKCNYVVPKGVSRQVIVVKRPSSYPHRRGVHKKTVYEKGRRVEKWVDDRGGQGDEIAAEISVCPKCMRAHNEAMKQQTL